MRPGPQRPVSRMGGTVTTRTRASARRASGGRRRDQAAEADRSGSAARRRPARRRGGGQPMAPLLRDTADRAGQAWAAGRQGPGPAGRQQALLRSAAGPVRRAERAPRGRCVPQQRPPGQRPQHQRLGLRRRPRGCRSSSMTCSPSPGSAGPARSGSGFGWTRHWTARSPPCQPQSKRPVPSSSAPRGCPRCWATGPCW